MSRKHNRITIVVVLLFSITIVFAQTGFLDLKLAQAASHTSSSARTQSNTTAYNREKLTVQLGTTSFSTAHALRSNWAVGFGETSVTWKAYRGFTSLSEADFFRVTGNHKIALEVENYRSSPRSKMVWGVIASIIGFGLIVVPATNHDNAILMEPDPELGGMSIVEGTIWAGTAALSITTGLLLVVKGRKQLNKNCYPAAIAVDVADEYNERLRRRYHINE